MSQELKGLFPKLSSDSYKITSPKTPRYNCIAWAAENTTHWWWPAPPPYAFWPPEVPREETLECFVATFSKYGYQPCASDHLEIGYEKVAIYVDSTGTPTHMARQLGSGAWTSKLGKHEDIEHAILEQLEGEYEYGVAYQILKRPI